MARAARFLRWSIVCFLAILLVAAVVLWLMVHAVPEGYVRDLHKHGAEQIQQAASKCDQTFSADVRSPLQRREPIEATFTDFSINARMHQLIRSGQLALPEGLSDPQVAFRPGRFVLMARLRYGAIETVISADCSPTVDAEGRLRLGLGSLKAGVLPMPESVLNMLLAQLEARIEELGGRDDADDERRWLAGIKTLATGGTVDTAELPGLRRDAYRVREIVLGQGQLTFRILPGSRDP